MIKKRSWKTFVKANLPELVRREGMTPQQAMKALAKWWHQYKKVGLRYNPGTKEFHVGDEVKILEFGEMGKLKRPSKGLVVGYGPGEDIYQVRVSSATLPESVHASWMEKTGKKRKITGDSWRNPGTNWHVYRANELRKIRSKYKGTSPLMTEQWNYANQRALENELAADASRRLGMNPIFAMCGRCCKYHKRGSKIFNAHKEYLGMYLDTGTGSRRQTTPKHIRDYWEMRRKGELNPTKKKFPLLGLALIGGLVYWIWRANKQT